jgi:hypothetical protein
VCVDIIMMMKHAESHFNKLMMVVVVFAVLVLSTFSYSVVYSQQASTEALNATALPSSSPPKLHAVKIVSPIKGQQVAAGKELTVIGGSLDNATTNCQVSIIVNGIKPYQPATGTGHGGATDYSTWNFVLTSNYTSIKPGTNNKITARYICMDKPGIASFYSVNVTGVNVATSQKNQTGTVRNATVANNM